MARSNKRKLLLDKISLLAEHPDALANNVTQLQGSSDFRLRVQDWRIIFARRHSELYVYEVAPRGSVYED